MTGPDVDLDGLRDELADLLQPRDLVDRETVQKLTSLGADSMNALIDMLVRLESLAYRHGTKDAQLDNYDRGFDDGAQAARARADRKRDGGAS